MRWRAACCHWRCTLGFRRSGHHRERSYVALARRHGRRITGRPVSNSVRIAQELRGLPRLLVWVQVREAQHATHGIPRRDPLGLGGHRPTPANGPCRPASPERLRGTRGQCAQRQPWFGLVYVLESPLKFGRLTVLRSPEVIDRHTISGPGRLRVDQSREGIERPQSPRS